MFASEAWKMFNPPTFWVWKQINLPEVGPKIFHPRPIYMKLSMLQKYRDSQSNE